MSGEYEWMRQGGSSKGLPYFEPRPEQVACHICARMCGGGRGEDKYDGILMHLKAKHGLTLSYLDAINFWESAK